MQTSSLLDAGRWRHRLFSGGWRDTGPTLDVIEPATGEPLTRTGRAVPDDVAAAAAAAAVAQPGWAAKPPRERAEVFRQAWQWLTVWDTAPAYPF